MEQRLVPATVRFVAGRLVISQPAAGGSGLTVTQGASETFSVSENGHSLGTFEGVHSINILGGNADDRVTVNLTKSFRGSLAVNLGAGDDTFTLNDGRGAVLNSVLLDAGSGNDTVTVNVADRTRLLNPLLLVTGAGNDTFTVTGASEAFLRETFLVTGSGNDTVTVNGAAVSFSGTRSLAQ
jgi:hypothetical protein